MSRMVPWELLSERGLERTPHPHLPNIWMKTRSLEENYVVVCFFACLFFKNKAAESKAPDTLSQSGLEGSQSLLLVCW